MIDHCPGTPAREYTMKIVQQIYAQEYSKDFLIEFHGMQIRMIRKPTFLPEKHLVPSI